MHVTGGLISEMHKWYIHDRLCNLHNICRVYLEPLRDPSLHNALKQAKNYPGNVRDWRVKDVSGRLHPDDGQSEQRK